MAIWAGSPLPSPGPRHGREGPQDRLVRRHERHAELLREDHELAVVRRAVGDLHTREDLRRRNRKLPAAKLAFGFIGDLQSRLELEVRPPQAARQYIEKLRAP